MPTFTVYFSLISFVPAFWSCPLMVLITPEQPVWSVTFKTDQPLYRPQPFLYSRAIIPHKNLCSTLWLEASLVLSFILTQLQQIAGYFLPLSLGQNISSFKNVFFKLGAIRIFICFHSGEPQWWATVVSCSGELQWWAAVVSCSGELCPSPFFHLSALSPIAL